MASFFCSGVREGGAAHGLSLSFGAASAFGGTGTDKVALHIRQAAEHREHQTAGKSKKTLSADQSLGHPRRRGDDVVSFASFRRTHSRSGAERRVEAVRQRDRRLAENRGADPFPGDLHLASFHLWGLH